LKIINSSLQAISTMRISRLFLPLFALFLLQASLTTAQTATTTRSLSGFEKVSISGGFDAVILKEGSAESVTLETSGVDVDKIITEVKGGTLEIGMKKGRYSNFHARITVTYRSLRQINNSGSTDVEIASTVRGEAFEINSSGSGDFKGAFDVQSLEAKISGSSDMKFTGRADKQDYAISGSGEIQAGELKGKEANVAVSGSGEIHLHVDGPVRQVVSGSGEVINKP